MPRPRFHRAAPEKRDALLDAAAKEFAAHGYENASINRILAAAGFSKGAFYYYFDDKADLAAAAMVRETSEYLHAFASVPLPVTAGEFWREMERLQAQATGHMRRSGSSDLLARLGTAAAKDPQLLERIMPFMQKAVDTFVAYFRRGQEIGAVRRDLSIEKLMGILQGTKLAVGLALLPSDRAPTAEEFAEFTRVNFDSMRRLTEPRPEEHS